MYKIVVADDELWFRMGIKGSIQWSMYGIEIVGEASDGEEALEVIEREKPDIVFVDIRMPVMDGLELAENITRNYPRMKIIIVSGYEEFDYARKAISLGVSYYLTKPVDEEQLIKVVKSVIDEIRQDNEETMKRYKIEQQLKESLPLLRDKFLNSLVRGEIKEVAEIKSKLEFLSIPLRLNKNIVFIFDIEYNKNNNSSENEKDRQLMQFAAFNIIEEVVQSGKDILVFNGRNGNIIGLATFDDQIGGALININMSKLFEKCKAFILKYLGLSVTIGVSRVNNRWDTVETAYKEAVDASMHKLFLGRNQVIFYNDIAINMSSNRGYSFLDKEKLIDEIKVGNKENVDTILDGNLKELSIKGYIHYDCILQLYLGILGDILNYIHEVGADIDGIFDTNPFREVLEQSTLEDINEWFKDKCYRIINTISDLRQQQNQNAVEKIMDYIQTNFNRDISLNSAAEFVFLSPAYLSRLFRKETGKSFIEYIMEIRVKKAKELLASTDKKVYEIAKDVGYNDIGYFTKMFKAIEGITPAKYREMS